MRLNAVLVDSRWPEGAVAVLRAARDAGVADSTGMRTWPKRRSFETLLPLTDHAIFSEQALAQFAGPEALEKVVKYGCQVAAVTRGAQGVDWIEAGRNRHHPRVRCRCRRHEWCGATSFMGHGPWPSGQGLTASPPLVSRRQRRH